MVGHSAQLGAANHPLPSLPTGRDAIRITDGFFGPQMRASTPRIAPRFAHSLQTMDADTREAIPAMRLRRAYTLGRLELEFPTTRRSAACSSPSRSRFVSVWSLTHPELTTSSPSARRRPARPNDDVIRPRPNPGRPAPPTFSGPRGSRKSSSHSPAAPRIVVGVNWSRRLALSDRHRHAPAHAGIDDTNCSLQRRNPILMKPDLYRPWPQRGRPAHVASAHALRRVVLSSTASASIANARVQSAQSHLPTR